MAGTRRSTTTRHRHIGYGIWFLREAVAGDPRWREVVRDTLRELLPAVAESLTPPEGSRRVGPSVRSRGDSRLSPSTG